MRVVAAKIPEVALPHFQASARIEEVAFSRESPVRKCFPVTIASLPPRCRTYERASLFHRPCMHEP